MVKNLLRIGKTLSDLIIEGVVDEINEEDETMVTLDLNGAYVRRIMSTQSLKRAGITREEQGFELHYRKYESDGKVNEEFYIKPFSENEHGVAINLVPDLDISKFRRKN